MKKSRIAVTLGDPAGIGPEIVVKTFAKKELYEDADIVLVGDKNVVEKALEVTKLGLKINVIDHVKDGLYEYGTIDLIDLNNMSKDYEFGKVSAECGKAAYEYIFKAGELAMNGEVESVATSPINKESLRAAEIPFIGHTEMFEEISKVSDPLTMFEVEGLRVFFLSRHLSLRDAIDEVKYDKIYEYIQRCTEAMHRLGVEGTLAVAGLNPHSGEHGLFGYEEVDEIIPAIEDAKKKGYDVVGPIGADSVFAQGLQGKYAAVLSLYHDQGHIATKTYNFMKTISLTNSMPFLRTSVDHGTAFDVAGKNVASEVSMVEAVKLAAKYGPQFRKN
ncbi:4-hydroxythreonine-4-phosphate dehydrogenase PdxA [Anaerococcus sp. AGMB00486]|uniref:4-hydroxythreonine-4-phosphate dehydrogenase PdxA n=2 Tax=Anaerococcus TaxID=165779 RepID=A0ABX2NC03_9FIRM|nr:MULTISPECIES: 4-hydroxythreonine-4-phosphate dehydrogenase PdxA [Anaerococcus]MDY3006856.1 4-hydroxythreonine-4-phosphate dehydrogenase PdxA [Anaerococcus porci]MSS77817.1 4-hydroxythreonine-4-phosphate dehydrogenase PdxA [Anaerococcus porci]NVF12251.1 4-hydroxythreonine-4-phosphate dehydrogenase PdxA [Anaerococcus faecalis]